MHRNLLLVATVVALVSNVSAKGPTVRLEIAGGGLTSPITITDPGVLTSSNVFGDQFLGPIVESTSVDPAWTRYIVSFFVEPPGWMHQGVQKKYVVYYAKHPRTGEGFVYLPAPGEEWYRLNVSTILRNGLEGNWLHASSAWAKAVNRHLP